MHIPDSPLRVCHLPTPLLTLEGHHIRNLQSEEGQEDDCDYDADRRGENGTRSRKRQLKSKEEIEDDHSNNDDERGGAKLSKKRRKEECEDRYEPADGDENEDASSGGGDDDNGKKLTVWLKE